MYNYLAPTKDIEFLLTDYLDIYGKDRKIFSNLDVDFVNMILSEASKIAENDLFPTNASGDKIGCQLENDIVSTPESFKRVFNMLSEGGWFGLDCNEKYGGQQLPYILSTAVNEVFSSANQALTMFVGLTHGAYSAIYTHGTEEQKDYYLPKMVSGEWTGTMNLTEPQCGTDLGLIKTKAVPHDDNSYRITGTKIFITAGDHDLTDNIIHLVLARIPDAPEGVKGISLFIVPKFNTDGEYNIINKNNVNCIKIEEKMGIHGSPTCVMEYDEAKGYLIGEPNKGLKAMFTMMNEARLLVGLQGLSQAEVANQFAINYANDRIQGVDIVNIDNKKSVPIVSHPSMKKILMDNKVLIEGMRALLFQSALLIDEEKYENNKESADLVAIFTPIIKAFLTDTGFNITVKSQQIFGGHGYLEDWPMSQFVRDARISMLYEGTNEIQALDLVSRKLGVNNGLTLMTLFNDIKVYCESHKEDEEFYKLFVEPIKDASKKMQEVCMYYMSNTKNVVNIAGSADEFLKMFAYTLIGYEWSKIAKICLDKDTDIAKDKLKSSSYYMKKILPIVSYYHKVIIVGSEQLNDY